MKKISDLNNKNFYKINNFFEKSRESFYKSPYIVFAMIIVSIMLVIAYGQTFGEGGTNNFCLKIFFAFMLFLHGIQYILGICLFISIKLKKKVKRLFSIYYFAMVTTIALTFCLIALSNTAYLDYDDYSLFLAMLAYIFCIILFIICVFKEKRKLLEGYYLRESKESIIDVQKSKLYFSISLIPVFPLFIRAFRNNANISKVFGEVYTSIAFNYLAIVIVLIFIILLAKEVFYIYYSFKFKKEGLDEY